MLKLKYNIKNNNKRKAYKKKKNIKDKNMNKINNQ